MPGSCKDHLFGRQVLLSDGLQGNETDVLRPNCEAAKCSGLSWCPSPGNNRKALKLATSVPLAPTSSLRAQGLLSGEGAAVENTKGNRHGSAKLREQRFYTSSFASGASSSLRAGSGLDPQGLLSWHWEPRHLVMQHGVYQVHSDS